MSIYFLSLALCFIIVIFIIAIIIIIVIIIIIIVIVIIYMDIDIINRYLFIIILISNSPKTIRGEVMAWRGSNGGEKVGRRPNGTGASELVVEIKDERQI